MSILFDEFNKNFDPKVLTPNQMAMLRASKAEADPEEVKVLEDSRGIIAKYRIEVIYDYRRKKSDTCPCLINVYKSNGKLDLDLDTPLFFCSSEENPMYGCGSVLTEEEQEAQLEDGTYMTVLWCKKCQKYVNRLILCSSIFINQTPMIIAEKVYKLFRELDSNSDIVVKYFKRDIKKSNEGWGDKLETARDQRERAIYTLKSILKDIGDSGLIIKKIKDFLSV